MLLLFKHVIQGYEKEKLYNVHKFISRAHYSFSSGIALQVMAYSFTSHLTSKKVGKENVVHASQTSIATLS